MSNNSPNKNRENGFLEKLGMLAERNSRIESELYDRFSVKRGLRNKDGTGVLVGLTEIGEVHAYIMDEGERVPIEGRLFYRGIDISDLVRGFHEEKRHGFEECAYLLLFGVLPNREELAAFNRLLNEYRIIPEKADASMTLKNPSRNVMNNLARSVLGMYRYDEKPDDTSISNIIRQSIALISRISVFAAHNYRLMAHYYKEKSLIIHSPRPDLSTAENFLYMIRPDSRYTAKEAELLDLCILLHAEHGGGNNSTFTAHVVTSSGTDIYSAVASALGSLKGPRHGGANIKVMEMIEDIRKNIGYSADEKKTKDYLRRIMKGEVFDRSGLIYGLGHAVYTVSDPRAVILKEKGRELAGEKGMEDEFRLYEMVEKLGPEVFNEEKGINRPLCANVDLYSGMVYKMLDIPVELYTPLFAIGRIAGWCAHIVEEIINGGKIIRPAYKSIVRRSEYISMADRGRQE
ncbi:MAG: citrate/2-methylcitrate synthase [Candidatus Omnitrophica bacterium]|nr:citrate/2-methylcitrate synthase [Candidatus Omnitrophota bacterium]